MKTFSIQPKVGEENKIIPCPLCHSGNFKQLWDMDTYNYVKCDKCSLVYQNPQPNKEDITSRYDGSYFDYEIDNEENFLNLILLGLKDVKFDFKTNDSDKKVLDIGCATGLFLGYMKSLGWITRGVEVCKEAAEFGNNKRDVNIFTGVIEDLPEDDETFDIIHLSHVIEHINNPDDFVKNIYRLLKPGGKVYCTTPNISGFQVKLFKKEWRSAIPDHLSLFSKKTLKAIFTNNNFNICNVKTWGGLCANSSYPHIFKAILDPLAKRMGFGDVVIIEAVKPEYNQY